MNCTLISLFLSHFVLAIAVTKCRFPQSRPFNESYTRICLPKEDLNRSFALSTESPLADALNRNPMGQLTILMLIAHFTHIGNRVERLSKQKVPRFVIPPTSLCSLHHDKAPLSEVNQSLSELGFGVLGSPCATEISIKRKDTPNAYMDEFVSELKRVGVQVARAAGLVWKEAHTYQNYKYLDSFDKCELTRITGIRVNNKWGVHASVTNYPRETFKAEREREIISEVLQLDEMGGISSARMVLPSRAKDGAWVRNATTELALRNNIRGVSLFDERSIAAENPAVLAAIALRKHQRQQAQAYTRYSFIAILSIPVLTCLVPVAYFTDLSSPVSFWYSVTKNIVSGVPLFIKGVELILFVRGSKFLPEATITRFYGDENGIAVAETWFASCEVRNWIWVTGVVFLIFCTVVWTVSVVVEYVTMRIGLRRREERNIMLLEKARKEMDQSWTDAVCMKCGRPILRPDLLALSSVDPKGFIAAEMAM